MTLIPKTGAVAALAFGAALLGAVAPSTAQNRLNVTPPINDSRIKRTPPPILKCPYYRVVRTPDGGYRKEIAGWRTCSHRHYRHSSR